MSQSVLGIDIAKADFTCSLVLADGRMLGGRFANTKQGHKALGKWLTRHKAGKVHACLEATGTYGDELARYLFEGAHAVSLLNPSVIKAYGRSELRRNKTDKLDSELIARYCRDKKPALWQPPAAELSELQALERRLEALEGMRTQERNRLKSNPRSKAVAKSIRETMAILKSQITKVKKLIQDHVAKQENLREQSELIVSIPGLGALTAAKVLGEYPSIDKFRSVRQFVAYSGLTPENRTSGSSVRGKPSCSKLGSARLRRALYMPALVAWRYNPLIKAFCERLLARGKPKMAVIGAAMAKLLRLIYGVLKSGKPFDANHLPLPA